MPTIMFITEIVDPDTLEPLPMGEKGELVITPLVREAMPVLRYRTKDISWLNDEPCACGRKSLRMAKIQGRTDDMLIIRGVNVFPSQIESVLMAMSEVEPHYEIVVTRENYMDTHRGQGGGFQPGPFGQIHRAGAAPGQDPA